jgi:opacity protein-like surface antigen
MESTKWGTTVLSFDLITIAVVVVVAAAAAAAAAATTTTAVPSVISAIGVGVGGVIVGCYLIDGINHILFSMLHQCLYPLHC